MKKYLRSLLAGYILLPSLVFAQTPTPFEGCPGVSVAITRPGFNINLVPHQIYFIDDTTGAITPTGDPIDLQINAFGLNNEDGFLYGMYQTFNVANPFLARVGKNGKYKTVGTILAPQTGPFRVGIVNTAAGTMDDKDNFYFTAIVVNLQNVLQPPDIYVGKIREISHLHESNNPLNVTYKKIAPGTCILELLNALQNPLTGILQDIAYNPANGFVYTFLLGIGGANGKIAWFNPNSSTPVFVCINPPAPNPATADLSGLFFAADTLLNILTTDGKYYKGNVQTGAIMLVTQTTLPLLSGNLRGDMASCVGKKKLHPFEGCPGLALAITRPGINSTGGPHHIYKINPLNGNIQPMGHDINLQINGFGLNRKDGFLYGMHEVSEVFGPRLARVDSSGDYVDIDTIPAPPTTGSRKALINTAAATMDGDDNYYFTAIVVDTLHLTDLPRLYLGIISNISRLDAGDPIQVTYKRVRLGTCLDEILLSLSNPANGLLQDIVYNPEDGKIYTYIQSGVSPARGKLARFSRNRDNYTLNCINPHNPNVATQDLSGMHAGENGKLYILTTDGKYYRGNPDNGVITLVAQTSLPLLANNLRGDMASCIPGHHGEGHGDGDDDDDDDDGDKAVAAGEPFVRIWPNPVTGNEAIVDVTVPAQTAVDIQVITVDGNLSKSIKRVLAEGDNQLRIDVKDLKQGMYDVVLRFPSGKTTTTKFIKL